MKLKTMAVSILAISLAFLSATQASAQDDSLVKIGESPGLDAVEHADDVTLDMLQELSQSQTRDEIDEIWEGDAPAVGLAEDDGTISAAVPIEEEPAVSPLISWIAPGCTTTSICLISTKNVHFGYDGTGTLKVDLRSIRTAAAGSKQTKFTRDPGTVYTVNAGKQARFATPARIVKLYRWY